MGWLRHPKTTSEMRAYDPEYAHVVRPMRRPRNLLSAWDMRSMHHQPIRRAA